VRRLLRALDGRIYRAGDRITIEISAPRRRPEVIRVLIRDGRIPRIVLLP
jgi:hypothetical protein